MNKANCMVSLKKLEWINGQHLRALVDKDIDRLIGIIEPRLKESFPNNEFSREYLKKVLKATQQRLSNPKDFVPHFAYFFRDVDLDSEEAKKVYQERIQHIPNTSL